MDRSEGKMSIAARASRDAHVECAPILGAPLELSAAQVENVRHALGLTRQRRSYRNYFVTAKGCADFDAWNDLAARGLAVWRVKPPGMGGSDIFHCTRRLAEAVLRRGENLDDEDFPAALDKLAAASPLLPDDDTGSERSEHRDEPLKPASNLSGEAG